MKTIPNNLVESLREYLEAWLENNKEKMNEISNRKEFVEIRQRVAECIGSKVT